MDEDLVIGKTIYRSLSSSLKRLLIKNTNVNLAESEVYRHMRIKQIFTIAIWVIQLNASFELKTIF